jgi:hypothetical protein
MIAMRCVEYVTLMGSKRSMPKEVTFVANLRETMT